MKIAIAQTEIQFEQPEKNLKVARDWITKAAKNGADWIVFPEMSFTGFSMRVEQMALYASQIHQMMRELARQKRIAIGYGWISLESSGKGKNHYTILDDTGAVSTDFVKLHPFSYGQEQQYYTGGSALSFTTVGEFNVSLFLCYDLRFPEVFRIAAQRANLLLVPANWLHQRASHFQLLCRARAVENQAYVLGVNCVGQQGNNQFDGQSCFVNPEGALYCSCDEKPQLVYVECTNHAAQYRESFPAWQDRRPKLYAQLRETIGNTAQSSQPL